METIINQYVSFVKEAKNEERVLINIYDYVKLIVKEYKKTNNISLKSANIDCTEIVSIQEVAFKRVFYNIIDNAFKFAKRVMITVSRNKKGIIIDIEDNGIGVSWEDIGKLSTPFFQSETTQNQSSNGKNTGLGLSIAKDIVLANNGEISFNKSKRLKGLSVRIVIPLAFS